jgi:hypothetical protein
VQSEPIAAGETFAARKAEAKQLIDRGLATEVKPSTGKATKAKWKKRPTARCVVVLRFQVRRSEGPILPPSRPLQGATGAQSCG